jgi:predicted PurR-regulated permease PerM
VFFIFGFTALVPVVGIFIAVPIIALSIRFFRAPLSKTCSL